MVLRDCEDLTQLFIPGYLIEQNFNQTQLNLIKHNCSIEFDCVRQLNKIEHNHSIEFDCVGQSNKIETIVRLNSIVFGNRAKSNTEPF